MFVALYERGSAMWDWVRFYRAMKRMQGQREEDEEEKRKSRA